MNNLKNNYIVENLKIDFRGRKLFLLSLFFLFLFSTNVKASCTNISSCGILDTSGCIYNLTADVSNSTGNCIEILDGVQNTVLNCQGHSITGSGSYTGVNFPLTTTNDHNTVKNCKIQLEPKWRWN